MAGMIQYKYTVAMISGNLNPDFDIEGILPTLVDTRTLHAKEAIELLEENFGDRFFFKDTPTADIYTLSLHDALPILIWLDLVASLPLIKERILVIILLLHFLSLMLGSVLVLMLPLLVWLTPDLRIKKSLLKCNWTIRKRLPRCKMRLKKRLL